MFDLGRLIGDRPFGCFSGDLMDASIAGNLLEPAFRKLCHGALSGSARRRRPRRSPAPAPSNFPLARHAHARGRAIGPQRFNG
jgi:hypothetical protein